MNNQEKRLRTIELSLTPHQIVLLWVTTAAKNNFIMRTAPAQWPREVIANSVSVTVRNSMKGEADDSIERAITQARIEADSLFNLIVMANKSVHDTLLQREREFAILIPYVNTALRMNCSEDVVEYVRARVSDFVGEILLLETIISKLVAEHLEGSVALFSDTVATLKDQIEMLDEAVKCFNRFARQQNSKEMVVQGLRNTLLSESSRMLWRWAKHARLEALVAFGEGNEFNAEFNKTARQFSDVDEQPC